MATPLPIDKPWPRDPVVASIPGASPFFGCPPSFPPL